MKRVLRILALTLVLVCVTSCALAELPAYLHVGQLPLVDKDITLKVAMLCHDNTLEPEKTWTYAYIEQVMGIKFDIQYFYKSTRNESIALMMADRDLPDIILACGFSANELSTYGAVQGLLLDLAPYINEENAPNLTRLYEEHPEYKAELTMSTGEMYSIGAISQCDTGVPAWRMFYNYDWLEACNLDVPETLDDFLAMLRAFKKYADEQGIEGNAPFGGNYARYNATYFILNALGYNHTMNHEQQRSHDTDIMLRNGKVVMPAYDREVFPVYLNFMHTLYEEKLMEQDYWTLDKDTTKSHLTAGRYGTFQEIPALYGGAEFGTQWFGVQPLTSEYNDTPFWPNYSDQMIGEFVVSANTKYPELCVAFADHIYDPEVCEMFMNVKNGPSVNQPELFLGKTTGWFLDPETKEYVTQDYLDKQDQYSSFIYWKYENMFLWYPSAFGITRDDGLGIYIDENGNKLSIFPTPTGDTLKEIAQVRKETTNWTEQYHLSMYYGMNQYRTSEFTPTVCYFDEETTLRIEELQTLIDEYANQEIAKFIIGTRPLSELDDYFAEMDKLGAAEYVQYYADYYASMQ